MTGARIPSNWMSWHSKRSTRYHSDRKCTEGNNIERINLREGPGGRLLCDNCKEKSDKEFSYN